MRPMIAQRTTTCHYCNEEIVPGEWRLSDSGQAIITKRNGDKYTHYHRRHFHFEKEDQDRSCFDLYSLERFKKMPQGVRGRPGAGRPKLDITEEQMIVRRKLLKRLKHHINYYINSGRIMPQDSESKEDFDIRTKQIQRFSDHMTNIRESLLSNGGIPEHLQGLLQEDDVPSVEN